MTEYSLAGPGNVWESRIGDPRIQRAVTLMLVHPERDWSLVGLAAEANMSRSAFARRFRDLVGKTPLSYLRRLRMIRAAEMVAATTAPLYQIANRVGYSSNSAFSKAFHREMGLSPTRYRAQRGNPE